MKKWIVFITTILSLCSTVARADVLEDAVEAYQKGNYAQALELLPLIAEEGNAIAQGLLGQMYLRGEGVSQNYQQALKWCRLAGKQGNVNAQANLGLMYGQGKGVTQDYRQAVRWYRLAAK
ncbi:MAG: sel1 repeat family protein [Betaproteobacteria bacterium]|nr:MAG: sel1 repeat family protein [Betaproteobacteria bacterium]